MGCLALEIFDKEGTGSKFATLPENSSITITETSEIFDKGDAWSFGFTINAFVNGEIFGTSSDLHGSRIHDIMSGRKARLWVNNLILFTGYIKLDDEASIDKDGNVEIRLERGMKTFDEMIKDAKANQVPTLGDVPIGMALWRKRWARYHVTMTANVKLKGSLTKLVGIVTNNEGNVVFDGDGENLPVQEYPRMVFPKGTFLNLSTNQEEEVDYVNTHFPYDDEHPFCNTMLCYQKYGYAKKLENGTEVTDYSSQPEAEREYETMPANRVNSAPNFYVIYWIKCLMHYLGIHIDENQMMDVEDLRRLFFVNTNCVYKMPKKMRTCEGEPEYGKYTFVQGKRLVPEQFVPKQTVYGTVFYSGPKRMVNIKECGFKVTDYTLDGDADLDIEEITGKVTGVSEWSESMKQEYEEHNSYLHKAFASSECFPNVNISEVISALESGFGIRLLFNSDYNRVRIVLLRNIFRSHDVQTINCDVVEPDVLVENNIRGFRMTYDKADDTHFYYKGFADALPHKSELWPDNSDTHDYSHWKLDADYKNILSQVSAFNKTCYVTPTTGNAYIVKIDKNAKKYDDLHPSLFECAAFMDAEDGDCTGEEETIKTINVGFTPAIQNDLNFEEERNSNSRDQRFALFVDEKMRPRRPKLKDDDTDYNDPETYYNVDEGIYGADVSDYTRFSNMMVDGNVKPGEFAITSDMCNTIDGLSIDILMGISPRGGIEHVPHYTFSNVSIEGHINEGYRLYLQDNYEPNDDGVSPIETHDWGLTLGIMRGSGEDAYVSYGEDPDDKEDNTTWDVIPGSSVTAHPDICDSYGDIWSYGDLLHRGKFSLKLRAEKPNPYFNPKKKESADNRRLLEIDTPDLRNRGLCDYFYKEYSYWIRNARIVRRPVLMELAQLLSIDMTVRVTVGDVTGLIRKMKYTVNNQTGLGTVEMDIMYI